jgi:LacI family transcriptional regulator, purine nucleotide synthesis repressor
MATIKNVAKHAGVSTTTVSHVINKTRFVAENTKAAVWAAIKELHYSPSAVARSLKVNHTKSIGLLATSSEAPYFAEVIEAVENSCRSALTRIKGNALLLWLLAGYTVSMIALYLIHANTLFLSV